MKVNLNKYSFQKGKLKTSFLADLVRNESLKWFYEVNMRRHLKYFSKSFKRALIKEENT